MERGIEPSSEVSGASFLARLVVHDVVLDPPPMHDA